MGESIDAQVKRLVDQYVKEILHAEDDVEDQYELLGMDIGQVGEAAVPPLLEIFRTGSADRKSAALDLMRMAVPAGDPRLVEAAKSAVKHSDEKISALAVMVLSEMGSAEDVPALVEALDTSHFPYGIMDGLGRIGDERAVAPLAARLYEEMALHDAHYAVMALERIGTREAIEAIRIWRASDAGQRYIDFRVTGRLQALLMMTGGDSLVSSRLTPPQPGTPNYEYAVLEWQIYLRTLIVGLHLPSVSARAALELHRIGTPEALAALDQWRRQQQPGS